MRNIFLVFFALLSLNLFSQTKDSVSFSNIETINIYNNVRQLKRDTLILRNIVKEQDTIISKQRLIISNDSFIINSHVKIIEFYKENEDTYKNIINDKDKINYVRSLSHFGFGMLSGIIMILIITN
jgi:hypothetical protein